MSLPKNPARNQLIDARSLSASDKELIKRQIRCIAIVGAGASAPLFPRADELATELEAEFGLDEEALERLKLVYNMKSDAFETRLLAMSGHPDAERKMRKAISDRYDLRHPAVLAYELIAHLLKHRFLDAIISFNFDELLDQSLDDEMGATEYKSVIFERDRASVQSDVDADDYVPLYIKLHGTAGEPDSLRFTPDSYYSIPPRILELVRNLFHAKHCVVVNVGAGLESFDIQRLLAIPSQLDLYNLSREKLQSRVKGKINNERKRAKKESGDLHSKENWRHECSQGKRNCDTQMRELTSALRQATETAPALSSSQAGTLAGFVTFRSVRRHEVVDRLLGPAAMQGILAANKDWADQAEIDYLKRRTILELAFAGAKARGLLSLVPLARDRPARYYDLYWKKTGGNGDDWEALCSEAGLVETEQIPDVLVSHERFRQEKSAAPNETHALHRFDCEKLADHVLSKVNNPSAPDDLKLLTEGLEGLQTQFDIELHTQDDRVCSKAFKYPITLKTKTSLNVYTSLILDGLGPKDSVYVSAEVGGWLLEEPIPTLLENRGQMRVIVAFDARQEDLERQYGKESEPTVDSEERDSEELPLIVACINPWHHNRHMTIICKEGRPTRAIYFARHLRTPVITAVYLKSIRDVEHLKKTFDARWEEWEDRQQSSGIGQSQAEP